MKLLSLEGKLAALLLATFLAGAAGAGLAVRYLDSIWLGIAAASALAVLPMLWLARNATAPLRRLLRALSGAIASYRDGDFSLSLVVDRHDELGELILAHNQLGRALREQRQHLVQRELLLDTVTQHSPVALFLTDPHERVVYANIAAHHLLNEGRSLQGLDFSTLLSRCPDALRHAVASGEDSLFSLELEGAEETFHLSQRAFRLQGRSHRLYLLKRLTRELSRQEVATWKKLIRVLSHELNNSLAPISSLAHSGAELTRRGSLERLPQVFASISERAGHLHAFIEGYASFARLPAPRGQAVEWGSFLDALALHSSFTRVGTLPARAGWFDPAQIEQVLINLLKNAHEAGSPPAAVELEVLPSADGCAIEIRDRGSGMGEAVLANALLPFYSTKRDGTGLGLALAREIVEAHGGRLALSNRDDGGLCVRIGLPTRD